MKLQVGQDSVQMIPNVDIWREDKRELLMDPSDGLDRMLTSYSLELRRLISFKGCLASWGITLCNS
jgi:hypothetical protein